MSEFIFPDISIKSFNLSQMTTVCICRMSAMFALAGNGAGLIIKELKIRRQEVVEMLKGVEDEA